VWPEEQDGVVVLVDWLLCFDPILYLLEIYLNKKWLLKMDGSG
jgi:hypothetical protein